MKNRKILYKTAEKSEYASYTDIGACEKHYDFLPLFNEDDLSYSTWYNDFLLQEIGVQMLTLHYYLLQFNSDNYLPANLDSRISKNIELLNNFNEQWFEIEAPIFNGLDFNSQEIEEKIISITENEKGVRTEIKFADGSSIKFLNEDDTIQSFYVPESDFIGLKKQFDFILDKLR